MISAAFFEVSRLQAITFQRAFRFLDGNCLRQRRNVIYQAAVTTGTTITTESYIGLSSNLLQRTVHKSLNILPTREQKKRDGTVQTGVDPQRCLQILSRAGESTQEL